MCVVCFAPGEWQSFSCSIGRTSSTNMYTDEPPPHHILAKISQTQSPSAIHPAAPFAPMASAHSNTHVCAYVCIWRQTDRQQPVLHTQGKGREGREGPLHQQQNGGSVASHPLCSAPPQLAVYINSQTDRQQQATISPIHRILVHRVRMLGHNAPERVTEGVLLLLVTQQRCVVVYMHYATTNPRGVLLEGHSTSLTWG